MTSQLPQFDKPIVFFDGVCNLCNGVVQFLILNDTTKKLHYSSLQSDSGQAVTRSLNMPTKELDSIIFYDGKNYNTHDKAILKIVPYLPWHFQFIRIGWVLPSFIRKGMYNWVARNRYRIFGQKDECMLPRPEWKALFVA